MGRLRLSTLPWLHAHNIRFLGDLIDTPTVVTGAAVQDEPTYCFCKEVINDYIFNLFSKFNSNLPLGRTWHDGWMWQQHLPHRVVSLCMCPAAEETKGQMVLPQLSRQSTFRNEAQSSVIERAGKLEPFVFVCCLVVCECMWTVRKLNKFSLLMHISNC